MVLLDCLAFVNLLQRVPGLLEVFHSRLLPSTWRSTTQTSSTNSSSNCHLPGSRQRLHMHLSVYTSRSRLYFRTTEDLQMRQHLGLLPDERSLDDLDRFVDLYPALPSGTQAANPSTTKDWARCHARIRLVVSGFSKSFFVAPTDVLSTCMSSIIRITYIPNMLFSKDQTWTISGPMYWSVIETNVGILTASMPAFKAIAKKYAPKLLGGSYDSNRYPSRSVHIRAGSSGFHKMGGTGGSNHMALDTIDRDLGMSKGRFQTTINQDTDSVSSSEEALHPPDRIGVTRQVHVEGESRSVFEERNSLSSHKDHRELS